MDGHSAGATMINSTSSPPERRVYYISVTYLFYCEKLRLQYNVMTRVLCVKQWAAAVWRLGTNSRSSALVKSFHCSNNRQLLDVQKILQFYMLLFHADQSPSPAVSSSSLESWSKTVLSSVGAQFCCQLYPSAPSPGRPAIGPWITVLASSYSQKYLRKGVK